MERESKRKAATAATPETEGRASKRQKLPDDDNGDKETPETTFVKGMKFLETMKAAKDKTGRPIATSFLDLPDKDTIPEYYQEIKLPIAFSTIEAKLQAREYSTLAAVESDVKRMVNNAKQFNDKNSAIYADAERVRKTASNFMTKNNPAYRTPGYSAVATPIPGEEANGVPSSVTRQLSERPKRNAAVAQIATQSVQATPSRTRKSERHPTPRQEQTPGQETDFRGKTFQEAQEALIQEFIHYADPEEGLQIYQPFVNLPNRSLKEYYATINTPMSLNQVLKRIRGWINREHGFSGTSDFKNWQQLEECARLIWENAREFNEDGSDMYNLAGEFEEHFKRRLADAMEKVPAPKQTIKLTMGSQQQQSQQQKPSGIKLRLGGNKNSPAPNASTPGTPGARSSSTPGVIVDNDALERQQKHVQAGMNGQRPPSSGGPGVSTTRSGSAASPAPNGVKSENQAGQSPALDSIRPSSAVPDSRPGASSQPPGNSAAPPGASRPASGSPYTNGHVAMAHPPAHSLNGFDNKHRQPGSNMADALLPNVAIHSHPALKLSRPFKFNIPASQTLSQQSITISLPGSHSSIQIKPFVPVAQTQRPWRLFVTVNNTRISEVYQPPTQQQANSSGSPEKPQQQAREKGHPLFEARLQPGVNRIDIEVVAGTAPMQVRGQPPPKERDAVEMEKCTVFVNLMRA
ncbi:Protein polybromo-1 [Lasiodiplodia hormozganensis]|uniref:Protein polybromo-1 n=1 Tax=Lasiodiplodia hormozganensis TaxID=869390 RepID=A0AA39Z025_9PEZI|nr:Protein polybromo-1 [Lasiodiplodia hormozganensis]